MKKTSIAMLLVLISFSSTSTYVSAEPTVSPNENVTVNTLPVVYLNKATIDELASLKGIGLKKAQAIVSYRETIGKFVSTDDLLNVKGIGEKIIADNQQRLKI